MPLTFTGETGSNANFETMLEAYDGEIRVIVITSREAIDDYGLAAVQQRASAKWDAGQREDGNKVRVFTSDFS